MSNITPDQNSPVVSYTDLPNAYQEKVEEIIGVCEESQKNGLADENRQQTVALVLNLLQMRDDLAQRITAKQLTADEIQTVIEADRKLKKNTHLIAGGVQKETFQNWRDSGLNPTADEQAVSWWWQ